MKRKLLSLADLKFIARFGETWALVAAGVLIGWLVG
jgi:hypothetical protein